MTENSTLLERKDSEDSPLRILVAEDLSHVSRLMVQRFRGLIARELVFAVHTSANEENDLQSSKSSIILNDNPLHHDQGAVFEDIPKPKVEYIEESSGIETLRKICKRPIALLMADINLDGKGKIKNGVNMVAALGLTQKEIEESETVGPVGITAKIDENDEKSVNKLLLGPDISINLEKEAIKITEEVRARIRRIPKILVTAGTLGRYERREILALKKGIVQALFHKDDWLPIDAARAILPFALACQFYPEQFAEISTLSIFNFDEDREREALKKLGKKAPMALRFREAARESLLNNKDGKGYFYQALTPEERAGLKKMNVIFGGYQSD